MPPLQRQDSRPSIYSWWSDSNPLVHSGPTINLHAAAKPLMRFMYHRQALALIESNHKTGLSSPLMEDFLSYLLCKYVSRRTQMLVLEDLSGRAWCDPDDAQEIQQSHFLDQVPELLADEKLRELTVDLLETLLARTLGGPMLPNLLFEDKHDLSDHPDSQGCWLEIMAALASHARHPESEHPLVLLLDSNMRHMRLWACKNINYFQDEPSMERWTFPATKLVQLLRDEDEDVIDQATFALARGLGRRPDVAAHIFAAATLENCSKELCQRLARQDDSLALSILLDHIPMANWLNDLRNMDEVLMDKTIDKLVRVSRAPGGPAAILGAGILENLPELLSHSSASGRSRTCELVDDLSAYPTAWVPDMLPILHEFLEADTEDAVIGLAYALNQLVEDLQSVRVPLAVIRYPFRNLVWDLVKHRAKHEVQTCKPQLCSELQSVIKAALATLPFQDLLDLLKNKKVKTLRTVAQTLVHLTRWQAGAEALAASRDVDERLSGLLTSPFAEVRESSYTIIRNLARYEIHLPGILPVDLRLRDERMAAHIYAMRENEREAQTTADERAVSTT